MLPWTPLSERKNNLRNKRGGSVDTTSVSANGVLPRDKHGSFNNLWRPSSLINLVNPLRRRDSSVYDSSPTDDVSNGNNEPLKKDTAIVTASATDLDVEKSLKPIPSKKKRDSWGTVVTIVLVEAKGLPDVPTDGSSHGLYCKIRLGSQSLKSKTVQNGERPEWRERFQLYMLKDSVMKISLCDKGKQKTFMGSCTLDLSNFEKERTHEIWQQLDNGYGSLHLSVTICNIRKINLDKDPCGAENVQSQSRHANFNGTSDWRLVGQLYVKVVSGKGLSGKFSSYCTLEVDNERVRTHSARGAEPAWGKSFVFNVYDATSTLDLKLYETSLMILHSESLGRLSVPLLRIRNGEAKWFALKDKNKRNIAKTSCPRVLLEMSFYYNPVKASLRLFRPKEVKYLKKPPKFDIALVYKNLEFVKDVFVFLINLNESYKRLFEWENRELSFIALSGWLIFWYNFKLWTTPLFLLIPFSYFWICNRNHLEKSFMRGYGVIESTEKEDKWRPERSLTGRLTQLPDMTLTITNSVDYLASLVEKLYNLASFKVPFLSYLTMILLIVASAGLYLIPFNCIMMFLGIYKFTRKLLKPDRILNNDLEDFLSRIPDSEILNDWKELNVPEPAPMNGINVANRPYTIKDSVMY